LSKRRILFCGNGNSAEILKELKDIYEIYVIDIFKNDRGLEAADKFIRANPFDPESVLQAAHRLYESGYKFEAVLSLCVDTAMSVSRIAEYYNLFSIPFDVARQSTIKSIRSNLFSKHNIASPKYAVCNTYSELREKVYEFGLPVVLKPVNLFASKGVILVESYGELEGAYKYCSSAAGDSTIIVNEYLKGIEFSTEGLMVDGRLYLTAVSERVFNYQKYKPYFVEVGDIMPTLLSDDEVGKIKKLTEEATLALDITNGVVKGDIIYTDDKQFYVLEITPRLGGPRFGTEMVPLSNGTNILKAAIQQALKEGINYDYLKPKTKNGMVNRTIFPSEGKITKIDGLDKIHSFPGFYDFKWWRSEPYREGEKVKSPTNMSEGLGYIIVTGKDRTEAIENADRIEKTIQIEIE